MKYFLLLLMLMTLTAFATEDVYTFKNKNDETRFFELSSSLRCLVCQNQNLAESNAPLAVDLRNVIYTQINNGRNNTDIIHFLVARYGDFILYKPPLNKTTLLLWFSPLLVFGFGLISLLRYIKNFAR